MSDELPEGESAPEAAAEPEPEPVSSAAAEEAGAAGGAPPPEANAPPEEAPAAGAFNEHEILGEQFENYLRIAQAYMKTLKRPKDVEICSELLRKTQRQNDSKHLEVKRHNNAFCRYCLRVIKWTSDNQPDQLYRNWYRTAEVAEPSGESRTWLEDNKSYMATKVLKDGTNLIYAAIADDPTAGWQDGGLSILAKRGACAKL